MIFEIELFIPAMKESG